MIDIHHDRDANLVTIRAGGVLDAADYDRALPELERAIDTTPGRLNALIILEDLRGLSPAAIWKDLSFDVAHYHDFARMAVVDADGALPGIEGLSALLTGADVEVFGKDEVAAAKDWLARPATAPRGREPGRSRPR